MSKGKIGAIIAGVLILGLVAGGIKCTTKIDAGHVGVVYSMNGGIQSNVLPQGWHIVDPTKKVVEYSVATTQAYLSKDSKEGSKEDDSFNIPTSDGKTVNVDLEFSYHFNAEKLPDTYVRFAGQDGETIENTFIRGKMKAWASEISSTFSVLDVYGEKRAALNSAVFKHAKEKFTEYGIEIDSVNFSRIELDSQTATAIQSRIDAQQALEKAKIEAEKAKIDAEQAKAKAQGEADAQLIKAKAEAQANELKQKSVTPELVQYEIAQKWDGKLPTVSGSNSIIQLPIDK